MNPKIILTQTILKDKLILHIMHIDKELSNIYRSFAYEHLASVWISDLVYRPEYSSTKRLILCGDSFIKRQKTLGYLLIIDHPSPSILSGDIIAALEEITQVQMSHMILGEES